MNGIQKMVINHPGLTTILIAGLGAWFAVSIYRVGLASQELKGNWQIATSEALGG